MSVFHAKIEHQDCVAVKQYQLSDQGLPILFSVTQIPHNDSNPGAPPNPSSGATPDQHHGSTGLHDSTTATQLGPILAGPLLSAVPAAAVRWRDSDDPRVTNIGDSGLRWTATGPDGLSGLLLDVSGQGRGVYVQAI